MSCELSHLVAIQFAVACNRSCSLAPPCPVPRAYRGHKMRAVARVLLRALLQTALAASSLHHCRENCTLTCEPWCTEPCHELNGNNSTILEECSGCSGAKFACQPGVQGFPIHPAPPASPSLHAFFDLAHGCRPSELRNADCSQLAARSSQPGRSFCSRAYCVAHTLSREEGAQLDPARAIRSPGALLSHEHLPTRLAAADLFVALCSQLEGTHLLEGASCLALAANQTESGQISIRWVGVHAVMRLVDAEPPPQLGWGAPRRVTFGRAGAPGSTLSPRRALDEMQRRLGHAQPGTRWMCLHALAALAQRSAASLVDARPRRPDEYDGEAHGGAGEVLVALVAAMQDDMGFPGIGLLSMESMAGVAAALDQHERLLSLLSPHLQVERTGWSDGGTSGDLIRLLAIQAASRVGRARHSKAVEAGLEHRSPAAREAALLALQTMQPSGNTVRALVRTLVDDAHLQVGCAASRLLSFSAWSPVDGSGAAEAADTWREALALLCVPTSTEIRAAHSAYRNGESHEPAYEQLVASPARTLARLISAPPTPELAHLLLDYVSAQPREAELSPHGAGERQRLRWRALLTLPFVAPRGSAAGAAVQPRALRMLAGGDNVGSMDPVLVFDRYAGMKALGMVAAGGDGAAIDGLAAALRDKIDVIKLQAAEHLVAIATLHGEAEDTESARGDSEASSSSTSSEAERGRLGDALLVGADALVAQVRQGDAYTRFAGAVGLRKLADAACGGASTAAAAVDAAMLGQLHAPQSSECALACGHVRSIVERCRGATAGFEEGGGRGSKLVSAAAVDAIGAATPADTAPVDGAGAASLMGVVGPDHCIARMRRLPTPIAAAAFARMREEKRCGAMRDEAHARSKGVLIVPGVLTPKARAASLAHLHELLLTHEANETLETLDVTRLQGRTSYRTTDPAGLDAACDRMDSGCDHMNALLTSVAAKGITLPMPYPTLYPDDQHEQGSSPPSAIRTLEHVVLDPKMLGGCRPPGPRDLNPLPCGCDWHFDGGRRGYKLWSVLDKRGGQALRRRSNIVIVPADHVQQLCDIAAELNASSSEPMVDDNDNAERTRDEMERRVEVGSDEDYMRRVSAQYDEVRAHSQARWIIRTSDPSGTARPEATDPDEYVARLRDNLALEAAGCVADIDEGDVLLFFPGTLHRTQDVEQHRTALIAEAF